MTTLFIFSLFGLSAMIGSKIFEAKVRKIHFVSRVVEKGDSTIHRLIGLTIVKYRLYKKIISLFLFEFLPSYAYELTVRLKDYLAKKYYSAGDGFRGRRVLRSNGSVSFFLQKITEKKSDTSHHKV